MIGSLLGEVFYQGVKNIEANGNKVLDSKALGKVSLFILNPAGEISKKLNNIFDSKVVQSSSTYFFVRQQQDDEGRAFVGSTKNKTGIGLEFLFRFW